MAVLNSVPEVSVSRVDLLRLEELRLLADGSYMKTEVESIRSRRGSSRHVLQVYSSRVDVYLVLALK